MRIRDACPAWGSSRYKQHVQTCHGQQQCTACERQCGATAADHLMADEWRAMVAPLLREPISLRGSCRAVGGSLTWLLGLMVPCFAACPDDLYVQRPRRPTGVVRRRLEADEGRRSSLTCVALPKKSLRISFDVLDSWPREAFTYKERQIRF